MFIRDTTNFNYRWENILLHCKKCTKVFLKYRSMKKHESTFLFIIFFLESELTQARPENSSNSSIRFEYEKKMTMMKKSPGYPTTLPSPVLSTLPVAFIIFLRLMDLQYGNTIVERCGAVRSVPVGEM